MRSSSRSTAAATTSTCPITIAALVKKTVRFLQERAEIGAIFVDDRYGEIPGTMPLSAIHAENAAGRNPDIILSYDYDENA